MELENSSSRNGSLNNDSVKKENADNGTYKIPKNDSSCNCDENTDTEHYCKFNCNFGPSNEDSDKKPITLNDTGTILVNKSVNDSEDSNAISKESNVEIVQKQIPDTEMDTVQVDNVNETTNLKYVYKSINKSSLTPISEKKSEKEMDIYQLPVNSVVSDNEAKSLPCTISKPSNEDSTQSKISTLKETPVVVQDIYMMPINSVANEASSLKIKDNDTNETLCCSCDAKSVASYYCKDCSSEDQAEYLCSICVEAHKTVRLTRNHVIYDSSLYSTLKRLFEGSFSCECCEKNQAASHYCKDCSTPDTPEYLCSHCVEAHKRVRVTRNHVIYDSSLYATVNKKK